jgi:centromere protein I
MVYLPMWNGVSNLGPILDLLAYIPLGDFAQLYPVMLAPLEQSVLGSAQSPFETLFGFYSQLVPRWLTSYSARTADRTLFAYYTSLSSLLDHIATLALSAIVSSPIAGPSVTRYYDTVATVTQTLIDSTRSSNPIPIALPPPHLFYLIIFSPSLTALSTLLSALSSFKVVVERAIKRPLPSSASSTFSTAVSNANSSVLSSLNAYLLDAANLLWRSRALAPDPPANTACMVPDATRKALMAHLPDIRRHYSVPLVFGLTGHVLLSGAAHVAWRKLEDEMMEMDQDRMAIDGEVQRRHNGPVSQRSLAALVTDGGISADWRDVRERMVKYLEQNGVDGIEKFRKAAMGNRG